MDLTVIRGTAWVAGSARGPALRLGRPLSLWGGVDPATGRITDPRHPNWNAQVAGTILLLPGAIGSSSSSAILLELIRAGRAPLAIVLDRPDAILALGSLVARELGYGSVPILIAPEAHWGEVGSGDTVEVRPLPASPP